MPSKSTQPDRWDSKAKLAALIRTSLMNEAGRSTYCRENGSYVKQLDAWKQAFEAPDASSGAVDRGELQRERKKSHQLAKELHRKERALAETAALLTLSKKRGPSGVSTRAIDRRDDETDGYPVDRRSSPGRRAPAQGV